MHKPDDLVIVNMEENIISLPDGDILYAFISVSCQTFPMILSGNPLQRLELQGQVLTTGLFDNPGYHMRTGEDCREMLE
jgi:hypothetical protein